jgi:hypothetical protein
MERGAAKNGDRFQQMAVWLGLLLQVSWKGIRAEAGAPDGL